MKRFMIILMVVIVLVSLGGCISNTEKQAMITFTRQALEIEGKRNDLVNVYAPLEPKIGVAGARWVISKTFLGGVPPKTYNLLNVPPNGIEGMTSLKQRLLLLDCPQELQPIKDSLLNIYSSEMTFTEKTREVPSRGTEKARLEAYTVGGPLYGRDSQGQQVAISIDNLDYWTKRLAEVAPNSKSYFPLGLPSMYHNIISSDWYKTQSFRRDVYIQWAELLEKHGVDLKREGFTELTKDRVAKEVSAPTAPTVAPQKQPVTNEMLDRILSLTTGRPPPESITPIQVEQWNALRQEGGTPVQHIFFKVWYDNGSLTPQEETLLKRLFEKYPLGQENFNIWYKQTARQVYDKWFNSQ